MTLDALTKLEALTVRGEATAVMARCPTMLVKGEAIAYVGEWDEMNYLKALRNAGPALIECARLLRKARESVEYEMQELHESYGDRLMHKQQPVIDLLAAIDAALARLPKETK